MVRRDRRAEQPPQYRCSLINIEQSRDEELDAILGELSELETQFSREITEERKRSSDESGAGSSAGTGAGVVSVRGGEHGTAPGRNCSPDTDSAFCDNLSVLSSCSAGSSRTDQSKKSSGVSSAMSHSTPGESSARIKAEKIKIAIEKIKEASVKKLFIKVFTSDGSAKSLLVDEKMTVGQVTRILAEKNHVSLDPKWALVELVPDLYMERVYEDHELLVENCLLWKVDSKNTLWFIERPEKFDLFSRPENYLLGSSSSQKDDAMEEHCRQELVEEYFSSTGVGAPQMEGYCWLKAENKKSWKKFHFILRTSGLYYSPKGKKTSKDLLCLCTFDVNQVYYGVGWKRKFKAPSDFCFGIKHPQIQAKNPKYIRYLCVDSQKELHQWVTGVRMAKNGKNLHENYRSLVDEITHADIDLLMGKRGSTNSAVCLVGQSKAESCATNLHLSLHPPPSPTAVSPISENKSFDSAVSSGIRSDHFLECCPVLASSSDLARFDLRVNSGGAATPGTLRRTSKSSSSLSDKSEPRPEQGFESDHPAGGTIKKRPGAGGVVAGWQEGGGAAEGGLGNIRLGAGGTLLRRTNSAERLNNGKNYEELQQLLDELHTNVKQAKDIQAKIKSSIEEGGSEQFPPPPPAKADPPPPPPVRTSSRLSVDEESLPPPPAELAAPPSPAPLHATHATLPRKNLPPIAPKPQLNRVPGSPKFKASYGTLPNPAKKSAKQNEGKNYKSGRRISFDDNIQLIEDPPPSFTPPPPAAREPRLSPGFLQGLEQVVAARPAEPLYTAVVKPGSGRPRHYRAGPGCCVPSPACHQGGDSSPDTATYRQWRPPPSPQQHSRAAPGPHQYPSTGVSAGQYCPAPLPGPGWTARCQSEEKPSTTRPCDDIVRGRQHSSVPSSPTLAPHPTPSASRLWGSFRGKKPPVIDKRTFSPFLKSAS